MPHETAAPAAANDPFAPEDGAAVLERLGRERPRVVVYAASESEHCLQLYAGLYGLHAARRIRLAQRLRSPLPVEAPSGLLIEVEGVRAFLDVRDGAAFYGDIASRVPLYAKRSFDPARHPQPPFAPLGLNYAVYADRVTRQELARAAMSALRGSRLGGKRLALALARLVPGLAPRLGVPLVSAISPAAPPDAGPPRAIFLARTWNPAEVPGLPREEVEALNASRAECIRKLRAALGERVLAGFDRSAHALEHYGDCVAPAGTRTRRRDYLRLVRGYAVCVATTGLSGSIGWKLAEYAALGRAIVCEPLRFVPPGPFVDGTNYASFRTPEECVARVRALLEDAPRRQAMQAANAAYYADWVAPDVMVGRVILRALALRG